MRSTSKFPSIRQRGIAMMFALASMIIIFTLGLAIASITMQQLHQAAYVRYNTTAFNLAESGADRAVRWFKDQSSPPNKTVAWDPFGGATSMLTGTYQVTATPDPSNAGSILKKYQISVVGIFRDVSQTVNLTIRQTSFGKYAYFTDQETSSITGGAIWFYSGDKIRGPAHSNNKNGSNFQVNWGAAATLGTIFEGQVTSVASSITYSPSSPNKEADFLSIYKTGSKGYHLGVDPIDMPTTSNLQRDAAWGSSSGFPTTNGVYIKDGGGVYIRGDATVVLSNSGSKQIYTIGTNSKSYVVTYDLTAKTVTMKVGSTTTSVTGLGSQVMYCTGNITSLEGQMADNLEDGTDITQRNAMTIATDVANSKTITLTNTLTSKTPYDSTKDTTDSNNLKPATLGLVAKDITIGTSCPNAMEVDAVMMAGNGSAGSFSVANYDSRAKGTLKVVGGVIQKARGPVGTLSGNVLSTGYAKNYYYDARMADDPPPSFPTTGGYDQISWQRF